MLPVTEHISEFLRMDVLNNGQVNKEMGFFSPTIPDAVSGQQAHFAILIASSV